MPIFCNESYFFAPSPLPLNLTVPTIPYSSDISSIEWGWALSFLQFPALSPLAVNSLMTAFWQCHKHNKYWTMKENKWKTSENYSFGRNIAIMKPRRCSVFLLCLFCRWHEKALSHRYPTKYSKDLRLKVELLCCVLSE